MRRLIAAISAVLAVYIVATPAQASTSAGFNVVITVKPAPAPDKKTAAAPKPAPADGARCSTTGGTVSCVQDAGVAAPKITTIEPTQAQQPKVVVIEY